MEDVDTDFSNYIKYTVKKGDTLYSIAKEFDTTVDKIKSDNDLSSNNLEIGMVLLIQDNVNAVEECFGEDFDILDNYMTYIVQKGDSLYSIAKKFNTTVNEIETLNNLDSINLSIGQELKIPNTYGNTTKYIVQKGESLYSIAKKFGTTVDKIKQDNNLTSDVLTVGKTLMILDNTGVSAIEECYGEEFEGVNNYIVYTVQKGDSLYSIAKKFGTTVNEIEILNNLDSTNLSIGQELKIPGTEGGSTKYIVQKGESLDSIAKKFNTTVDAIKNKNNLTSNLLSIGQELII